MRTLQWQTFLSPTPLRWFRVWLSIGVVIIAAVFYLSLTPPINVPQEHYDKLYHAATYAILMVWFVQLFNGARSYLILAVAFIAMGALIEILQGFHPMRYFDVLDMLANAVGVVVIWLIANTRVSATLAWLEARLLTDSTE
ncbi:MAG: VanZ family protein [Pseudomonadota bacterium]